MTLNPALLLLNSPIEEALLIQELKSLHGDEWTSVYKDIKDKKRLEELYTTLNKSNKEICNIAKDSK